MANRRETTGDPYKIPCLWCGKEIRDAYELASGGDCGHCGGGVLSRRSLPRTRLARWALLGVWVLAPCSPSVAPDHVEGRMAQYLDRMYPGRHGPPQCGGLGFEASDWATCDAVADGALRRFVCVRASDCSGDVTCRYDFTVDPR
jgi:hypothetical protein